MSSERRNWTRRELLLAINLYCQIPFGRIHSKNPQIINLAQILGRTSGAVSWKLCNFAHIDPSLNRKGASNVSKLDRNVWAEFFDDWNTLAFESECCRMDMYGLPHPEEGEPFCSEKTGVDVERSVKTRVNQDFFRRMILSSYNGCCCLTGISIPDLLVASHIKPWSEDKENRTNPQNGLCLNALHDKAFDRGLISLSDDYSVIISDYVKQLSNQVPERQFVLAYEGRRINLPNRFLPNPAFLHFHRERVFKQ